MAETRSSRFMLEEFESLHARFAMPDPTISLNGFQITRASVQVSDALCATRKELQAGFDNKSTLIDCIGRDIVQFVIFIMNLEERVGLHFRELTIRKMKDSRSTMNIADLALLIARFKHEQDFEDS